jgi:conjugal transfer pilus assembly protein TraE
MKAAIQQSRLQQLIAQRNGYLVLATGLLLLCLLLCVMVFHLIGRERIIITPPVVHRSFWVDHNEVSPEYLAEMTTFFAQLRLTVTPSNAAFQRTTLLRYTDASAYGELNNELVAEADHLTQGHISLAFYPVNIEVDAKHLMARVEGDLYSTVGNTPAKPARIAYRVQYRYNQGRLWLQSFEEELSHPKKQEQLHG